ncbi:acylphosphatase [uncultured Methanospirillum sp.]|uniref:acylphosphatase n=1 Tax=uncultured Methanospirillum sp. TaxID=262503 RepID=UPI0029C8757B|nr:acylphosphatase [uncultured Methanospirillum sp.]
MTVQRRRIVAEGRVQGVGYRMFVRDLAAMFHLNGWVKNHADGTVEAVIEGEEEVVREMIDAMYARDSYVIRVDRLIVTKEAPAGDTDFEIRR